MLQFCERKPFKRFNITEVISRVYMSLKIDSSYCMNEEFFCWVGLSRRNILYHRRDYIFIQICNLNTWNMFWNYTALWLRVNVRREKASLFRRHKDVASCAANLDRWGYTKPYQQNISNWDLIKFSQYSLRWDRWVGSTGIRDYKIK